MGSAVSCCKRIKKEICTKQEPIKKIPEINSSDYVKMRKISDNFYTLTRRKKHWSKKQIAFLESILNYKMFHPIPRSFVREAIFGTKNEDGDYTKDPPKFVLLNFDSKNGTKQSLRGLASVSVDGVGEHLTYPYRDMPPLEFQYYTLELIGNLSIRNQVCSAAKQRNGVKVKSGKDMLEFLKKFGKKAGYQYFKLYAMENVIGFYWKYGWRFSEFECTQRESSIKTLDDRVKKLNTINRLINPKKYTIFDDFRDRILTKYFDRYLDDYYNVMELSRGNQWSEDYEYYDIKDTLTFKRWDMRFQGYPIEKKNTLLFILQHAHY